MTSNKTKLGKFIQLHNNRNSNGAIRKVMGISVKKEFREPTSKVNKNQINSYKIVYPGQFAAVPTTHNEKCFAFAYNDTNEPIVVSSINTVFTVDEKYINAGWLRMYFNRPEFDRYARFHSWGSAREIFSWEDMCDIEIDLPPIEIQKKYVDVYNAMMANQACYERGLEDLKLTCEGYIEDLRRKMPSEKIGPYINQCNERNTDNSIKLFQGVNVDHVFTDPKRIADDSTNGCVVRTGQFAFNKVMKANNTRLPIALRDGADCVVSSSYQVFEVSNQDKLLPKYLLLWMNRDETQRYAGFISVGTTRDIFSFEDLCEIAIPLPDIKVQQSIANIFEVYEKRHDICEKMRAQTKNICPILIKGSLEEANK